MATAEQPGTDRFFPIMEEIARALARNSVKPGKPDDAKALLRIEHEENVRRVIQAYWTPFEVNVPGRSIGLHLEVAEPLVHWAECYLTPYYRNWFLCFHERADGDVQLSYHADYSTPSEAIEGFFDHASWYVLTATDLDWSKTVYQVSEDLDWPQQLEVVAGSEISKTSKAVQESLKKSTITWLRWKLDGREHTMPVWYVYDAKADKIYVLSGERQQTIPGAERLRECDLILRWKGQNARVAEIPASVRVLQPGPEWDQVAEKLAEKRLNIPGLPEETAKRWRDQHVLLELTLNP